MQPASTGEQGERASRFRHAIDARREWMIQVLAAPSDRLADALSAAPRAGLSGGAGIAACAGLSDTFDQAVAELWAGVEGGLPDGHAMCLVATGGWGRREVCPHSDIDLLLLAPPGLADVARDAAERLLYPLWDAGVRVGHAVRDPSACVQLARGDLATATALVDARYLVGHRGLFDELARGTRRAVAPGGNPNQFVNRLAEERARRHDRFGDSLYLLEPNLKQGIGALRDLCTAMWAARARWAVGDLDELVAQGELSARQAGLLAEARDFLLRLRSLVQLQAGRATDQLTFEIQEAIAPRLYPDAHAPESPPPAPTVPAARVSVEPAVAPAVEALMRDYYLHARAVVRVADRLLEAARVPERRKPRIGRVDASFLLWNGQLAASDPAVFRDRPSEMVRLFRVALDQDVAIYGHTKEVVAERLAVDPDALAGDAEAARHFLAALCDLRDGRQPSLLEEMHQVGMLAALMPEFAPCTCRVQHDLYHVYTVDQHQLYAVAMLKRTMRGELAAEAPLATEVARELAAAGAPPAPLLLGTLLHDVGKPLGRGHAEKGARLAAAVAGRLGLSEADAARTEMLVLQHLTMAHLSQRRDLTDPEVVRRFAARIGDEIAIAQLYLLTRCDTAMTAPGNLSAWKDQLLGELYTRARDRCRGAASGGERTDGADRQRAVEAARARVRELLPADAPALAGLVDALDDRTVAALSPRQIARHLALVHRRAQNRIAVDIEVTAYPLKGHTEVAVVADDSGGLLAHITGVLSAHRVSVDSAVVTTVAPPGGGPALVLDLFSVRDPYGKAIAADDSRWDAIRADLARVVQPGAEPGAAVAELLDRRRKRSSLRPRVTPAVATSVQVVQDASLDFTVIEVATRDRVGVLHSITRTLAELGLDIHLAKVSTEGEKVADAFYVTDRRAGGGKLAGTDRVREVERALQGALAERPAREKS
ncbi:MAG TPA: ACT domain-containing protein [Kofleriaceae bacterium]|nr:ACT domain-containing protein [Kofleriaceae bacterium]